VAYTRPSPPRHSAGTSRCPRENTGPLVPTGWPNTSTARTLPASDAGSAASAASPVSPVPTYSVPSGPKTSPPPLCASPRGRPGTTVFGVPPSGNRTTRLSVAVET
jgi:hypothetical protein